MGIEPLYTIKVAAELIPMPSANALHQWLFKNPDVFAEKRYRRGSYGIDRRLLSESEILLIRSMVLKSTTNLGSRRRTPSARNDDWRYNLLKTVING